MTKVAKRKDSFNNKINSCLGSQFYVIGYAEKYNCFIVKQTGNGCTCDDQAYAIENEMEKDGYTDITITFNRPLFTTKDIVLFTSLNDEMIRIMYFNN